MGNNRFLRGWNQVNHLTESPDKLSLLLFCILNFLLHFDMESQKSKLNQHIHHNNVQQKFTIPPEGPYLLVSSSKQLEQPEFLLLLLELVMEQHQQSLSMPTAHSRKCTIIYIYTYSILTTVHQWQYANLWNKLNLTFTADIYSQGWSRTKNFRSCYEFSQRTYENICNCKVNTLSREKK